MNKCFAYYESWKSGVRRCSCGILNTTAFERIHNKRGGCCMENCAFYKERADQIRSGEFLYDMSKKQKEEQLMFYTMNYKGNPNIKY